MFCGQEPTMVHYSKQTAGRALNEHQGDQLSSLLCRSASNESLITLTPSLPAFASKLATGSWSRTTRRGPSRGLGRSGGGCRRWAGRNKWRERQEQGLVRNEAASGVKKTFFGCNLSGLYTIKRCQLFRQKFPQTIVVAVLTELLLPWVTRHK